MTVSRILFKRISNRLLSTPCRISQVTVFVPLSLDPAGPLKQALPAPLVICLRPIPATRKGVILHQRPPHVPLIVRAVMCSLKAAGILPLPRHILILAAAIRCQTAILLLAIMASFLWSLYALEGSIAPVIPRPLHASPTSMASLLVGRHTIALCPHVRALLLPLVLSPV